MFLWRICLLLLLVSISSGCSVDKAQPSKTVSPEADEFSTVLITPTPESASLAQTQIPRNHVMVQEQTSGPSPTAAICTALTEGMRLRIIPVSETAFYIELAGFQAGEDLLFLLAGEAKDQGFKLESRPAARIDAGGEFRSDRFNLEPYSPISEWQGKVIHSQGVACFEITLPLPPDSTDLGG